MNGSTQQHPKYPDNNPKTLAGSKKVPLHLVPPSAKHFLAMAMEDGAGKYGPYNWRDIPVAVSPYYSAAQRHLDAFWDGEDVAQDSKVQHLAHAMACCAILLDAMTCDALVDDRPKKGAAPGLQTAYVNNKKNKEKNDTGQQVPSEPLSTGDRQIPLFTMEGRL